jgi:hypothetical protein
MLFINVHKFKWSLLYDNFFVDSDISIACCIDIYGGFLNEFLIFLMCSNVLVCWYLHFFKHKLHFLCYKHIYSCQIGSAINSPSI